MKQLEKALKEFELYVACHEICDPKNATFIRNALRRYANIRTIEELNSADLDTIKFKNVGPFRFELMKKLKLFVNDEEKMQSIWETNDTLRRFGSDENLRNRAVALRDAGYKQQQMADTLGIDVEMACRIRLNR